MVEAARQDDAPERPGVRTGLVIAVVAGSFLVFAGAIFGLRFLYLAAIGPDFKISPASFPAPQLDPSEAVHRRSLQATERRKLTSYGWVDRKAGLVRIPISRAMGILAGRGPSAFAPMPGVASGGAGAPKLNPSSAVPQAPGASSPANAAPLISGGGGATSPGQQQGGR